MAQWQCQPPPEVVALPATALPFTPAPARPAQRLVVGHKAVLEGYCHEIGPQAATSQDYNQVVGPQMAVPGSRPPCPSAPTQLASPPRALPGAAAAPCPWAHTFGPRQHHYGGAEYARGGPAVTPSSVAQGLRNPLLPVAGVTEAPSGHTWDSGTCLW